MSVLHAVTFLGDEEFSLLVFPILYWSVSRRVGIRVGVLLLLSAGINAIGKLLVASPRPLFLDPSVGRVHETTFGIPSGHAQNAVAVWGLLAVLVRRRWAMACAVGLAGLIGWSRVELGAHFVTDVVVGWVIGAALLALFVWLEPPVRRRIADLAPSTQVVAGVGTAAVLIGVGLLASARLATRSFSWPGLVDVAAATGASAVVTPAATLAGLTVGLVVLHHRGGFDSGGPAQHRLARVAVGTVGVLVLWRGLAAVLPVGEDVVALFARALRYALVGAWVGGFAPLLFVRLGLAEQP